MAGNLLGGILDRSVHRVAPRQDSLVPILHEGVSMTGCAGCSFKGASTAIEDNFVGVRFSEETNLTLCSTRGGLYTKGDRVIVDLQSGPAFGFVEQSPMPVFKPCQKASAQPILRRAADGDIEAHDRKLQREGDARRFVREKARELELDLKVSKIEFSLSGKKATVYFTAERRIDFRALVREVGQRFSTKVRMVQLGARDEAKLLGGIGVCGRTLCCSSWLTDFRPISIQMAKRQGLSLNPSKISGQCGRLLCCLAYEDDQYRKSRPPAEGTVAHG
jgi:cell fate regulator YaaT (PSP1 superfamily)